jgi:hypothetical protein
LFNQALLSSAFILKIMPGRKKRSAEKGPAQPAPELQTEGPLKERDQQGQAMERARKLGEEALKQWRLLKQKIGVKFK